ncbi:MAG: carbon-nitrogen hydrolase family protein [Bryobacteraceae bacterium]|nr:carbon-nitrogen hydrolase family protein [Bryobacteraceae bacterium]
MYRWLSLLLLPLTATPAEHVVFTQSDFRETAGWTTWSHRADSLPRTFTEPRHSRGEPGSLAISGDSNPAAYGGWERQIPQITAGRWYRATAYYRADAVPAENWQAVSRLDWRQANGQRAGEVDYLAWATRDGAWTRLTIEAPAPPQAAAVRWQFYLANAPQGTLYWDDLKLEEIPTPAPRLVKVSTIRRRPTRTPDPVGDFLATAATQVPAGTDLIVFPEGITVIGTGKAYADVVETIPGPTTERLGKLARDRRAYVVAGLYEREGKVLYNTAVLLDRQGQIAGRYRKVYLPAGEVEGGLTPGLSYPVFTTDFGTLGMLICYDVFFPEPARALASQGADLIVLPIWGGDETLAKARAIENGVHLISSGYDYPTHIINPVGEILAQAPKDGTTATVTLDLERRYPAQYLGDVRTRRLKESRPDVPVAIPGLRR